MIYIYTCSSDAKSFAKNELKSVGANVTEDLSVNTGIVEYSQNLSNIIKKNKIVFVRHIFKVDKIINLGPDTYSHITEFLTANLNKLQSFCIQIRKTLNSSLNNELVYNIASQLQTDGYTLDVKYGKQIVSIFANDKCLYLGIGNQQENLSRFKGGEYHFAITPDFICRAEHKLLEAIDAFDIDFSNKHLAVDLGSAPGGWSKVLCENGLKVCSVDPAALNEKFKQTANIIHYKQTAQEFLRTNTDKKFDVLVNDMKMDSYKTVEVVNLFYEQMNKGAYVIVTFKLPHNFKTQQIKHCLNDLEKKYTIIAARQLFHNRSEITVFAKKE